MMVVMVMVTLVAMVAVAMADDRMVARVTPRSRRRTPRRGRSTSRRFPRISSTITPRTSRGNAHKAETTPRRDERRARSRSPLLRGRWVRPPAHRRTGSGESAGGESASRGVAPPSAQSTARSAAQARSTARRRVRGARSDARDSGRRLDDAGDMTSSAPTPPFPGRDAAVEAKLDRRSGGRPSPGHRYGGESPGSPPPTPQTCELPEARVDDEVVDSVFIVCRYHVCIHRYNMSS